MAITTTNDQVGLVPAARTAVGQAWLATFHGPGGDFRTYVDMTTVPAWDGRTVRAVDLDLDVIERLDGTVFVDDQDEFDEHRVAFGYPREVVDLAMATRDLVRTAVAQRHPAVRRPGGGVAGGPQRGGRAVSAWADYRLEVFGEPYMVWHDGPDFNEIARR